MKVVLLNPPGDKLYVRSYYCGATSKADYLFQPLDLLILSGILSQGHEITVLDCIAQRLNPAQALNRLELINPQAVISLVSMVSWSNDESFLRLLKARIPALKLIANGDIFFDQGKERMEACPYLDAVIFNFTSCDPLHYLAGEYAKITHMLYRRDGRIEYVRPAAQPLSGVFHIPVPRHELFCNRRYRFPFARRHPFATVLASFGCPFRCGFCIAHSLGFSWRTADEVMEELSYIHRLGIRELFFEDMSFGLPRENALRLLEGMRAARLEMGWTCFSRVDIVDEDFLRLMKECGCHTIMFGVESASEHLLKRYEKGYQLAQVEAAFAACRKLGIRTVATFILGLPEDTRETCLATIQFAKELACDYASFNVAVPRPGTALRTAALGAGLTTPEESDFDHSGSRNVLPTQYLTRQEVRQLRRRAIREFYLRPSYWWQHLRRGYTPAEFVSHLREFVGLLRNNL